MTGRGRRRRLGQHFLADRGLARGIVGLLADEPPRVVEIGPGRGALTEPLLERFERVVALEVDPTLAEALAGRLGARGLELHRVDALAAPFHELVGAEAPWQAVGNLPYSVGTAILRRLLPLSALFTRLVLMLQEEVALRIVARPGERDHGLLALERAAYAEARIVRRVGPGAFRPPPRVSSAVVVLDLRPPGVGTEALEAGFKLARRALTQPRKKLRNALAGVVEPAALAAAGLDPDARPGTLALEGWVRLGGVVGEGPGRG